MSVADGAASMYGTEAGVYVGCMYQEYTDVLARAGGKLNAASATGNSLAFMVGR
jgi:acyl transferase domain-containing protein